MKMIWFYDNYNDGQDHKFIVGDKLYNTLLRFCIFHAKSSECKEVEGDDEEYLKLASEVSCIECTGTLEGIE